MTTRTKLQMGLSLVVVLFLASCGGGGGGGGGGAATKSWGTAALSETDNAGDAGYPQIAVDAGGNAIAVWYQHDGTRWNIWANRYTAGSGWGGAGLLQNAHAG